MSITRTKIFETPRFKVINATIKTPKSIKEYYYISKPNAVAVIVTQNKKIGLIKIKRPLVNGCHYEVIGGRIESGEEDIIAANRELNEEIGLVSSNELVFITKIFPLPSITTEMVSIFHVNINENIDLNNIQDEEGIIDFNFYSKHEILEMIKNKKIMNAVDGYILLYYCFLYDKS